MDNNLNLQKQKQSLEQMHVEQREETMQTMQSQFMYGQPLTEEKQREEDRVANKAKLRMDVSAMETRITEQYPPEKITGSARKIQEPPHDDLLAGTGIMLQLSSYMKQRIAKEGSR